MRVGGIQNNGTPITKPHMSPISGNLTLESKRSDGKEPRYYLQGDRFQI